MGVKALTIVVNQPYGILEFRGLYFRFQAEEVMWKIFVIYIYTRYIK